MVEPRDAALGDVAASVALLRCPHIGMAEAIPSSPVRSRPHLRSRPETESAEVAYADARRLDGSNGLEVTMPHRLGVDRPVLTPSDATCLFLANSGG